VHGAIFTTRGQLFHGCHEVLVLQDHSKTWVFIFLLSSFGSDYIATRFPAMTTEDITREVPLK
jgi:hypothetical protein